MQASHVVSRDGDLLDAAKGIWRDAALCRHLRGP
jgi:hypothetical protein